MPDIIITPSSGKLEFVDTSAQSTRRHSFTMDANDGLNLDAHLSAAAISAPLNVINVTVNNSNANYPFVLAQSGETGAKNLLMDGAGGTYNPFTNTATIDISGNSATTTLASNSTNLGGVAAASYVTLTGTQTLTNKTITGTFTGNLTGTGSWATNAVNANTATNSTQLNGQSDSYYTNIPARLGYTPVNKAGDTISGNLTVNGNFAVNGSVTAFSASNIYITSSTLTVTDNILLMNALSPYQRYAGIQMYDSGSGTVSQFLWDGEGDYFFLTGSSVNGKIITGPDGQTNLTANYIPKATAGYKLGNSLIYDNGTNIGIGTTSPDALLNVVGGHIHVGNATAFDNPASWNRTILIDGTNHARLRVRATALVSGNNNVNEAYLWVDNSVAPYSGLYAGYGFKLETGNSTHITLFPSSGNVGIGVSSPTTALHVSGVISGSSFSGAGTGLTGTAAGLSIGGSAASSTTAGSATTVTGTNGQLLTKDVRTIAPNNIANGYFQFGFTSWTNNNNSPYADYLHLRSYTDSSGGNDNLVMFRKDAIGMRIWQQTFGSASNYSTYKDVAFTDQIGNGTITIAAGTGVGVGTTNTFTTNQSGATTVTITNTGVTSNVAGTGISVSGATGAVTITNSGVTSAVAGTGVGVSGATGAVTFSIGQAVGTGNSPTFAGLVSNGNVGIGSTSPAALLNIRASAPTGTGTVTTGTNVLIDSNANNYITFRNTADNGTYAGLVFLDNNVGGYIAFGNAGAAVGSDSMIYGAYQDHIFQNNYVNETLYNRTETMRIKQSGNVGIGTSSPSSRVHIYENANRVTYIAQNNNHIARFEAYGTATAIDTTASNGIFFRINGGDIVKFAADGNVGIGTNTVTAKVESYFSSNAVTINYLATNLNNNSPIPVYGFDVTNGSGETRSIKAGIGYERHLTNGRGTLHFYNDSTNDTQSLSGNRTSAGDIKMSIDNDGNVGIGTPTPTYKLQVQGSFYVNSTAYINGALTVDDNIIVTAGNDFGIYDSDGTGAYWQYMDSGIAYLRIDDGGSANGKLNINNGLLYVGASGGNVGINTTGANSRLHIYDNSDVWHFRLGGASGELRMGGQNNSGAVIQAYTPAGAVRDLYLQRDGGAIGIGTNSPLANCLATFKSSNTGRVAITDGTTTANMWPTGGNFYISTETASDLVIITNATERMRILSGGNVGIGTSNPGRKLDVEGIVRTRGASGTGGFEISAASSGTAKWRIEWDSASDSLDFNWVG